MGVIPQPDDPSVCPNCGKPQSACRTISSHPYMDEIAKLAETMPDGIEKDAIAWAHSQIERTAGDLLAISLLASEATTRAATKMTLAALAYPSAPHAAVEVSLVRAIDGLSDAAAAALSDDFQVWYDTTLEPNPAQPPEETP